MPIQTIFILSMALSAPAAAKAPAAANRPFTDIPRNHWAFEAVEAMRQRGILRGYPPAVPGEAGTFAAPAGGRAGKPATRRKSSKEAK